ncbi:phospholipid/cholesterol/gamma-HCH transport system permease protein [Mycobacterium sp. OAS707]|uniref:ABC transporter permease n=1 Tax=Mycobacterium sp. OAS707 TaxID=2663822 RepID=UPI00178A2A67|nr:phospholipid/cholesterol/gamma-HCH transport system permease protein [Mycobacterium sp. OAS707]
MGTPSALPSIRWLSLRPIRRQLMVAGQWALFICQTFWYVPLTVRRYYRQTLQAMNSLAWGRGSLIVDGGTISVLLLLGIAVGASVAIEGFAILNLIGFGALSGIIGGVGTVREIGPLVAGIAFTSQAGCRMTAEIGAMRISDEIDAVEALGLRPIPFVVGTRLIGGLLVVIPGYLLTLVGAFVVQRIFITVLYNQPGGTYSHYLSMFLTPTDLAYSTIKASVFCVAVTLIHCYYGYFTSGGPAGVGQASGRAVRASLVMVMVLDFMTTVALWGIQPQFVFRG